MTRNRPGTVVAPRPETDGRDLLKLFLVIVLAGLIIKLLCVTSREIIPTRFDAAYYVNVSLFRLPNPAPHHPVGASLVMALSRFVGAPYRLFEELLLAMALTAMLAPLCHSRIGFASATAIYILCLFNPGGVLVMDSALSEIPFLIWLMFAWSGILMAARSTRRSGFLIALIWTIVASALAGITRSEAPAFVAATASAAAVAFLMFRRIDKGYARKTAIGCVTAIVGFVGAEQAVNAYNSARFGFWGASYVESTEWWALYGTLLSLPSVDRGTRGEGSFTGRDVIGLAAKLSPTFEEVRACTRKKNRPWHWRIHWRFSSCLGDKGPDEVGKTWQIIDEIERNAAESGIELRPPLLSFIPQPFSNWLPTLPDAVKSVLARTVEVPSTTRIQYRDIAAKALRLKEMRESHGVSYPLWVGGVTDKLRKRFRRALNSREAVSATGVNPALPYQAPAITFVYTVLAFAGLIATALFCLAVLPLSFLGRPRSLCLDRATFFLALIASLFVAYRMVLYTLVEWMLWATQFRYAYVMQFVSTIPVVILVACLVSVILRRHRPSSR